mmetsp:Transcript_25466/g.75279  ORF Transcript_25466/g.75279 Transcript_25466/m.75279 type:complete len:212 (+) Transcript_25466:3072-3707(+)
MPQNSSSLLNSECMCWSTMPKQQLAIDFSRCARIRRDTSPQSTLPPRSLRDMAWKLSPLSWPDVRSGSALSWLGDTPPLNRSTSAAPLSWSMSANLLAFWKSLSASMSELLLYATSAARCQYSIALMVQCFSATSYPAHAWFQWYAIVVRLPTFSSDSDRSSSSASCACMRRRWKCGMTSYTMSRSTMLNSQMPASRSVGLSQPACCSSTR